MEDTLQEGQEKEEEQEKGNIKAEDNAIEMSDDFDGQMHDGDENEAGNLKRRLWVNAFKMCVLTSACCLR